MLAHGSPTLPVRSFDRAIEFYTETLGLTLQVRYEDQWACLDAGLQLALVPYEQLDDPRASVGLCVAEPIEDVYQRLLDLGVAFLGPIRADGMVKLAFFLDPDGNPLYLTSMRLPTVEPDGDRPGTRLPFLDHLGIRWQSADAQRAILELDARDDLRGPSGALQGGAIVTLVDIAAVSVAALTGPELIVTSDLSLKFLAPGRVGPVRAVAELVKKGSRGITVEVRVRDVGADERLIAIALVSFAALEPAAAEARR